jgi:hypothetical protein
MLKENQKAVENLKSQIVTSSWGGRRTSPYVFTEQGVAMLSSVLKSERAVQINILIMRAFVKLREIMISNEYIMERISQLEDKVDDNSQIILQIIRELIKPLPKNSNQKTRKIGYLD